MHGKLQLAVATPNDESCDMYCSSASITSVNPSRSSSSASCICVSLVNRSTRHIFHLSSVTLVDHHRIWPRLPILDDAYYGRWDQCHPDLAISCRACASTADVRSGSTGKRLVVSPSLRSDHLTRFARAASVSRIPGSIRMVLRVVLRRCV